MATSPYRKQDSRYLNTRKLHAGGLRFAWKIHQDVGYEPIFPFVFRDKGLDRGPSYDVFKTHYVEANTFGPKPLMRLEHLGCYELLYYYGEMGERFYALELAKRLAISRNTLTGYFDVLENLNLIRRIRNGRSFTRMINIVMRAPLSPDEIKVKGAGYKLYRRVHERYIQQEREDAGAARWPLIVWDYATTVEMLKTQESKKHLAGIRPAFDYAAGVIAKNPTRYTKLDGDDLTNAIHKMVREECERRGYPYTPRLFATEMAIQRMGATTEKDFATPKRKGAEV